jgi:hypothetical protein
MPDEPTAAPEEVTALQEIRINAVAAANSFLEVGPLTIADPARLLKLAETIAAYIVDGTIPPPSCTCAMVETTGATDREPRYVRGRANGCVIHESPAVEAAKEAARNA